MNIKRNAPVLAKGEIEIAADPETVWKVLATIDRWPEWDPSVRWVSLDGAVAKGTIFRWKSGRWKIISVIQNVKRARLMAWTGRMMGIRAVHAWRLEPSGLGTHVLNEESWDGDPRAPVPPLSAEGPGQSHRRRPRPPEGRGRAAGECAGLVKPRILKSTRGHFYARTLVL